MTETKNNIDHKIDYLYELMKWRQDEVKDFERRIKNNEDKLNEVSGPMFGVGQTADEEDENRREANSIKNNISSLKNQIAHQKQFIEHHIEVISWLEELKYEG